MENIVGVSSSYLKSSCVKLHFIRRISMFWIWTWIHPLLTDVIWYHIHIKVTDNHTKYLKVIFSEARSYCFMWKTHWSPESLWKTFDWTLCVRKLDMKRRLNHEANSRLKHAHCSVAYAGKIARKVTVWGAVAAPKVSPWEQIKLLTDIFVW